jgi:hypothetical protein
MESKNLLTKDQLATVLNVSLSTINSWMRKGILPFYKLSPRCIRFDMEKVNAAIQTMVESQAK